MVPHTGSAKGGGVGGRSDVSPLLGGWVTFTPDAEIGQSLGVAIHNRRDAIYLPTIQKDDKPVDLDTVNQLRAAAIKCRLSEQQPCSGAWILSADCGARSGQAQVEFIWRFAGDPGEVRPTELEKLAVRIAHNCNQDRVAFEVDGVLNFASARQAYRSGVRYTTPALPALVTGDRLWVFDANDADALASIARTALTCRDRNRDQQGVGCEVERH